MSGIDPDYSRRDPALPPNCKDLIDALKLESAQHVETKVIELQGSVTVRDLAALVGRKPFQIVGDLLEFSIFAHVDQPVTFEVAASVAGKYGFVVKRVEQ